MTIHIPLFIIGLIFFGCCTFLFVKQLRSLKTNTASVMAQVIDYDIEETTSAGSDNDATTIVYYPIMRYTVSGQFYEERSETGRGRKKYAVGEQVEIRYNPDAPENFIVAGDHLPMIAFSIGICIGIGIVILSFFAS